MIDHRAFVLNQMAADRYLVHANVRIAPRYGCDVLVRPIRALGIDYQDLVSTRWQILMTPVTQ